MPMLRNGRLELSNGPAREMIDLADIAGSADARRATSPIAVRISPGDKLATIEPILHRVDLVGIDFPAFTDGRGYSHARHLRRLFGYSGELRAIGDVRPDQLLFMLRAGFDAFELADGVDPALVERVQAIYSLNYQPSYPLPIAAG